MKKSKYLLLFPAVFLLTSLVGCNSTSSSSTNSSNSVSSSDFNEANNIIQNQNYKSATDFFFSQFSGATKRNKRRDVVYNKLETGNDQDSSSNIEEPTPNIYSAKDINGNTYKLQGDELSINLSNYKDNIEKEPLPCDIFDNGINTYNQEISTYLRNLEMSQSSVLNDPYYKVSLEVKNNGVKFKSIFSTYDNSETNYDFYSSKVNPNNKREIEFANLTVYGDVDINDLKVEDSNFYKGFYCHIKDEESYFYVSAGKEPDEEGILNFMTYISLEKDSDNNILIDSITLQDYRYPRVEHCSKYYRLEKFIKETDGAFSNTAKGLFFAGNDEPIEENFYTLFDQSGHILWDSSMNSLNNIKFSDLEGIDGVKFNIKNRVLDENLTPLAMRMPSILESLQNLQCLALTEEERNEEINLDTYQPDFSNIETYFSYLSYVEQFKDSKSNTLYRQLYNLKKLKDVFDAFNLSSYIDKPFMFKNDISDYLNACSFLSDLGENFTGYIGLCTYFLKYLTNLQYIDKEYVDSHEEILMPLFKINPKVIDQSSLDEYNQACIVSTALYNIVHNFSFFHIESYLLKDEEEVLKDLPIRIGLGYPYGSWMIPTYTNDMRRDDFDKLVECRNNNFIAPAEFSISISFDNCPVEVVSEKFKEAGIKYKGYEDLAELVNLFKNRKRVLTDTVDTEQINKLFTKYLNLIKNQFNGFSIK